MEMMIKQHKEREEQGKMLSENIHGVMNGHYQRMKHEIGIDEYSNDSDSFDEESEAVFRQLRPNA